jgi:hypothetical protein
MFFLGILSIFQIAALPGILILKLISVKGSLIQRVVYTFALSLIANYCLAFILAAVGLYNRWSMFLICTLEITAVLWLYRDDIKKPIAPILRNANVSLKNTVYSIFPHKDAQMIGQEENLLNTLLVLGSLGLAISSILWVFKIFIYNLGTVFNAWDTIVSWNSWATQWASGSIPLNSRLYPQLIPANWSMTYLFIGETTVQFFAKGIMPLFPLLILLAIFDLGLKRNPIGYFTGVTITRLLIKKFLAEEMTSGYVDLAVAFFAFLVVYVLINILDDMEHKQKHLLLGAIFAAGAAVTKQAGAYILIIFPILVYIRVHPLDMKTWKKYLRVFFLISLIPAIWYILKGIIILSGRDFPELRELVELSSATYGNSGILHQLIAAFTHFDWYLLFFVVILACFFRLSPINRTLTLLLIIPYPMIWAWFAGYDTRNLSIFIPVFGLVSGEALQEIYFAVSHKLRQSFLVNAKVYVLPILLILLLAVSGYLFPEERLRNEQIELQKMVFSPSKNQQIYDLIAHEGSDTKILTNYPVSYLPGLENNQIFFAFQDYAKFLSLETDPDVEFIFLSNSANEEIKKHIDRKIEEGNFKLLFIDKEWVTYRMIQIVKR